MKERKKHALCTLFNSVYADKGIVLYQSLEKVASNFTLYVLAMDDKCYDILCELDYKHLVPIKLEDFENEALLKAKSNRPFGQYCWTCSSSLIRYIIKTYSPDYCTYLDSDLAFYDDPYCLVDELESRNASISIIAHRFSWYDYKQIKSVGKYCVECNTFKNDINSIDLLEKWINLCLDDCSQKYDGIHWGDQKYWDDLSRSPIVIESKNMGAGIAPWNISQYRFVKKDNDGIILNYKGKKTKVLFYHFEGIKFSESHYVNIYPVYNVWFIDDNVVNVFYQSYIEKLIKIKYLLRDKYGVDTFIKYHPAIGPMKNENKVEWIKRNIIRMIHLDIKNIFMHSLPSKLHKSKNRVYYE